MDGKKALALLKANVAARKFSAQVIEPENDVKKCQDSPSTVFNDVVEVWCVEATFHNSKPSCIKCNDDPDCKPSLNCAKFLPYISVDQSRILIYGYYKCPVTKTYFSTVEDDFLGKNPLAKEHFDALVTREYILDVNFIQILTDYIGSCSIQALLDSMTRLRINSYNRQKRKFATYCDKIGDLAMRRVPISQEQFIDRSMTKLNKPTLLYDLWMEVLYLIMFIVGAWHNG